MQNKYTHLKPHTDVAILTIFLPLSITDENCLSTHYLMIYNHRIVCKVERQTNISHLDSNTDMEITLLDVHAAAKDSSIIHTY